MRAPGTVAAGETLLAVENVSLRFGGVKAITDVSFEQSLLDRIINSGSLRIESAGDSPDELLRNIPNSNHVQQLINRLIDEDDTRRRMVAGGRAAHGRPGYESAEEGDDFGRMPLSQDPDRRDRPRLAEE